MRLCIRSFIAPLAVAAAGLLSAGAQPLAAAVLYTNLGPGDSFSSTDSWAVTGPVTSNGTSSIGVQFVPTASGNVGSIDVAFFQDEASSASDIIFELRADNGSDAPDYAAGPLDVLTLAGTGIPETPALYNVSSTLFPFLTAGTSYWVVANTAGRGFFGWNQTDPIVNGNLYVDTTDNPPVGNGAVSPEVLATLRINAVPEPSTMALAAIGLGALVVFRRKTRGP